MNQDDIRPLQGSVSIFHAVIILCLLAFVFSMIDLTRYQMLKLEAMSSLKLAGENALSQYDPLMAKQYGLYAGEQGQNVSDCINKTIDHTIFRDESDQRTFFVDYLLNKESISSDDYNSNFTRPKSLDVQFEYIPWIESSFQHPKNQILTYMKQREPYLLLKPFLNNLDFLSKTSRTTTIIEEKNSLLTELECLDDYQIQLMLLIDGVHVNADQTKFFNDDISYIRKFYYKERTDNPFDPSDFTRSSERDYIDIEKHVTTIRESIIKLEAAMNSLIINDPYESVYLTPIGEEEPIFIGKKLTVDAETSINTLMKVTEELEAENEFLDELAQLANVHHQILDVLNTIETVSNTVLEKIQVFEEEELDQADIIESVRTEMNNDLETVKTTLSAQSLNLSDVNNLGLIKEQIESNLKILELVLPIAESIKNNTQSYVGQRFAQYSININYDADSKDRLLNYLKSSFTYSGRFDQNTDTLLISLTTLNDSLKNYQDALFLDYRLATDEVATVDTKESISQKKEGLFSLNLEQLFESKDIIPVLPSSMIDSSQLPSRLRSQNPIDVGTDQLTQDENKAAFTFDFSMLLGQAHDSILLNEYVIGMFGNIKKNNDLNSKTMNGYTLETHFLDYETEYVLNGSLDEKQNASIVLGYLYGVRMSCNIIHLATNVEKRQMIINAASTIAGWWTGGVGAILIGILLAAVWSLMESIIDVFLLTSGERVPFIKTTSTWYTSLDGDWESVFDTGVRRVENTMTKQSEEIKETISEFADKLIVSTEKNTEDIYVELADDIALQVENQANEYEQRIYGFLSELISREVKFYQYKHHSHSIELAEISNPFAPASEEYLLAERMRSEIKQQSTHYFSNSWSIENGIDFKKNIEEKFESEIQTQKDAFVHTMIESTQKIVSNSLNEAVIVSEEYIDRGLEISESYLHDKADEIKDKFKKEIVLETSQDTSKIDIIPTFSYEDYLRLFLMLPIVDDTTKVARIMDLIQMNLQKSKDDYSLQLCDYFSGLEIEGNLEVDLYFLPELKQYTSIGINNSNINTIEVTYEKYSK